MHRYPYFQLFLFMVLFCPPVSADDDFIKGHNTFIFRSYSDKIFSGTDVRREIDHDRYTIYDHLTIQYLKLYESDELRIFGSGSGWLRQELGDSPYHSDSRLELSYGSIQIDRSRSSDGYIKLGRIYNYQGLFHQRFDGAEVFYPFDSGIEINAYGGSRPYEYSEWADDTWLTGGRLGYRFKRRNTIGFSWLLTKSDDQWDDQKIGGDWFFTPWDWLELNGYWGVDLIASELYEINTGFLAHITRDFDFRFVYDNITPGLMIPKSSIFSVYSLAEEESLAAQLIYHPGNHWTVMSDIKYIDYSNEGGQGNFFTDILSLIHI